MTLSWSTSTAFVRNKTTLRNTHPTTYLWIDYLIIKDKIYLLAFRSNTSLTSLHSVSVLTIS